MQLLVKIGSIPSCFETSKLISTVKSDRLGNFHKSKLKSEQFRMKRK